MNVYIAGFEILQATTQKSNSHRVVCINYMHKSVVKPTTIAFYLNNFVDIII